jgi:hypothetical protein
MIWPVILTMPSFPLNKMLSPLLIPEPLQLMMLSQEEALNLDNISPLVSFIRCAQSLKTVEVASCGGRRRRCQK